MMNLLSRSLIVSVLVSFFSCSVSADSLKAAAERELQRLVDRDVEILRTAAPGSAHNGRGKRRFLLVSGILLSVVGTYALAVNLTETSGCAPTFRNPIP